MYQNMECAILGYNMLDYTVKYTVYNSANEPITNPIIINAVHANFGICVPYGGFIEIQMDNNHSITFKSPSGNTNLITISAGATNKVRVVRDYVVVVNTVTTENGRMVEIPITE